MNIPRFAVAAAALAASFLPGARAAPTDSSIERNRSVAVQNGSSTREIKEDMTGFGRGILGGLLRSRGRTPKEFGMSAECAKMRRKNKLHRLGLSHARI